MPILRLDVQFVLFIISASGFVVQNEKLWVQGLQALLLGHCDLMSWTKINFGKKVWLSYRVDVSVQFGCEF